MHGRPGCPELPGRDGRDFFEGAKKTKDNLVSQESPGATRSRH